MAEQTMRERLTDAAVRALPIRWQRGDAQKEYERGDVAPIINAVLATIEQAGLVIVPVEPTEAMKQAGSDKLTSLGFYGGLEGAQLEAEMIYAAMILSAKGEESNG